MVWIQQHSLSSKLIVDQFWFVLESFENAANVDFLWVGFAIDGVATAPRCFPQQLFGFNVFDWRNSLHLAGVKRIDLEGSESDSAPRYWDEEEDAVVLFNFSIFEVVSPAPQQLQLVRTDLFIGFAEQMAQEFVALFVD